MEIIDEIVIYIRQNPVLAIAGASFLILVAGFIMRKVKFIAIILILAASFVMYIFISGDKVGKIKIEELKKNVKEKVMENLNISE